MHPCTSTTGGCGPFVFFFLPCFFFCEEPKPMCNVICGEKINVFGVVHITGLTGFMLSLKY